jgi:hypothetical protein
MSKDHEDAKGLADVLTRLLTPIVDRLERLESKASPAASPPLSADETMAKLMAELRGQQADIDSFGLVEVVEGCTSDISGATFDAEIHYPVVRHMGRIVGKVADKGVVKVMRNYAWPVGIDKHVPEGVVPEGMTMFELGPQGQRETDSYRDWKYKTFAMADNRRFVGKALPAHVRATSTTAAQEKRLSELAAQVGTTTGKTGT